MKRKILVFSPSIITTNAFFIQSRVFQEITNLYDIYVCCNTAKKGSDLNLFKNRGFKGVYGYTWSAKRKKIWALQFHINTLGGRKFSKNCRIIYDMNKKFYGNIIERSIHRILGFSYYSAKAANYIFEKYVGEDKDIKDIVNSVKPDLIVTFLCGSSPLEIESIKAGKLNKIPVVGIQSGWDNISTRGLMPFLPDYMGVWGYQSRVFAEKIHMIPPERIFHAGAPFADRFRVPCDRPQSEIKTKLGLPYDKKVLFFAGNIWAYNEVRNLKLLDGAIENGALDNSCIFYRPHPFQHRSEKDLDFFTQNLKHVYLDPILAERYKSAKEKNKDFPIDKHRVPIDFEYLKEIFEISSIIISPLSTVIIQGAFYGVPSVGIVYTDEANRRYCKRCEFEELSIIRSMPGIFLCLRLGDLIPGSLKALRFSEDKSKISIMKQYVASIIHNDELSFAERLRHAIDAVLDTQRPSIFHFLNEPILDTAEKAIAHDVEEYGEG